MGVNIRDVRSGNVKFLIKQIGSQSLLAKALGHEPNQRRLSDIHRNKKKGMTDTEVLSVEKALGLPPGWMNKKNLLQKYWKIIMRIRTLSVDSS